MHLAVFARDAAVLFVDHRGVVVQAGGAALEQRAHQHDVVLLRQAAQTLGAGAGNRLGQVELANRLVLAEIRAVVQFLQQYQARAAAGGLGHAFLDHRQVGVGIAVVLFLDQGDGQGGLAGHGGGGIERTRMVTRMARPRADRG